MNIVHDEYWIDITFLYFVLGQGHHIRSSVNILMILLILALKNPLILLILMKTITKLIQNHIARNTNQIVVVMIVSYCQGNQLHNQAMSSHLKCCRRVNQKTRRRYEFTRRSSRPGEVVSAQIYPPYLPDLIKLQKKMLNFKIMLHSTWPTVIISSLFISYYLVKIIFFLLL